MMTFDELEYGDTVPGVVCPACGGELVYTSSGAFCDWCTAYVPVVGVAVLADDDDYQDTDDDNGGEW